MINMVNMIHVMDFIFGFIACIYIIIKCIKIYQFKMRIINLLYSRISREVDIVENSKHLNNETKIYLVESLQRDNIFYYVNNMPYIDLLFSRINYSEEANKCFEKLNKKITHRQNLENFGKKVKEILSNDKK